MPMRPCGKLSGFNPFPQPQQRRPSHWCAWHQSPMPSVETTNWPLGPGAPSWGRPKILDMMISYDLHLHCVHSIFQQSLLQNVTDLYSSRCLNQKNEVQSPERAFFSFVPLFQCIWSQIKGYVMIWSPNNSRVPLHMCIKLWIVLYFRAVPGSGIGPCKWDTQSTI